MFHAIVLKDMFNKCESKLSNLFCVMAIIASFLIFLSILFAPSLVVESIDIIISANAYSNTTSTIARSINETQSDSTNTIKSVGPIMLINIGVRSSGTTELGAIIGHNFLFKTVLCRSSKKRPCSEVHYWDRQMKDAHECFNSTFLQTNFIKQKNETIFKFVNKSTHISMNNNQSICNPNDYLQEWYNNKKVNKLDLNNIILYEKTPKYYMYPHIGFIFSKHNLFKYAKILILLRDPIKSCLSNYYDEITLEYKKHKHSQIKTHFRLPNQYRIQQFMNYHYFINDDFISIRNKFLLPFIDFNININF